VCSFLFPGGAQMHLSFLENVKDDPRLEMYHFPLWDFHATHYTRWSINSLIFKGGHESLCVLYCYVRSSVCPSAMVPDRRVCLSVRPSLSVMTHDRLRRVCLFSACMSACLSARPYYQS
jgi:hypothetical protein